MTNLAENWNSKKARTLDEQPSSQKISILLGGEVKEIVGGLTLFINKEAIRVEVKELVNLLSRKYNIKPK